MLIWVSKYITDTYENMTQPYEPIDTVSRIPMVDPKVFSKDYRLISNFNDTRRSLFWCCGFSWLFNITYEVSCLDPLNKSNKYLLKLYR